MSGLSWDGTGSHTRIFPLDSDSFDNAKLTEDRYEVFVNGELVGNKTLLNQNDSLTDIDDFLRAKGFSTYTTTQNGDHYDIQVSEVERKDIKDTLQVYLNNR
ncbi:hypothetical protein [Fredinandcohnia sp. 179-A 10B2 NHS]|uniref:hypothetical protein n=1 Tax=Fredinandcohnia sp. 179-A 10B2 NHS TaxID=3235176 RepID=UPI0039A0CF32